MRLLDKLSRAWAGDAGEPSVLDHAPVPASAQDWRAERLKDAARKHGKPFLCAADGLPREIMRDGHYVNATPQPTAHKAIAPSDESKGRKALRAVGGRKE